MLPVCVFWRGVQVDGFLEEYFELKDKEEVKMCLVELVEKKGGGSSAYEAAVRGAMSEKVIELSLDCNASKRELLGSLLAFLHSGNVIAGGGGGGGWRAEVEAAVTRQVWLGVRFMSMVT